MYPDRVSVTHARALRKSLTPPEARLWTVLRRRALLGLKFRRQHPAGPFVLDFYCPSAKLVVEVDGVIHSLGDGPERDARRDLWLERHGMTVLRVSAADVKDNLDGVLKLIGDAAARAMADLDEGGGPLRRPCAATPPCGGDDGGGPLRRPAGDTSP